jgi:hypothetical protein
MMFSMVMFTDIGIWDGKFYAREPLNSACNIEAKLIEFVQIILFLQQPYDGS